jgi:hypothetical protein
MALLEVIQLLEYHVLHTNATRWPVRNMVICTTKLVTLCLEK